MTPKDGEKKEIAQTAPANPTETKETSNKSDSKWGPLKTKAEKAWKALKEGLNGNVFDKLAAIPNFFKAFFDEVNTVDTEEEKKNKETAAKTGAVLKNLDSDSAVKALAPSFSAKDKDGNVIEPPAVVNDSLGIAWSVATTLDTDRQKSKKATDGTTMGVLGQIADKADPKKNPDKKPLSTDEQKLAFSYGSRFVIALKDKYPDKADFKKALDDFSSSTEGAPIGFHTFQTETFKGLFSGGDKLKIFDPILSKIGWLDKGKLLAGFATKSFTSDLKTGKIPDLLVKTSAEILPNTSEANRTNLLKIIGQILSQKELGSTFPTNEQLTNIVFAVDNKDLRKLSNAFA